MHTQNIFLTGGNVLFPNFKERLERDLLASRPYGSSFAVSLVRYLPHYHPR